MTLADRIVVMHGGHIQQQGKPEELFKNPVNKFVAGFLGTPPMNFLDAEINEELIACLQGLANHMTILMVTSDPGYLAICHKVFKVTRESIEVLPHAGIQSSGAFGNWNQAVGEQ